MIEEGPVVDSDAIDVCCRGRYAGPISPRPTSDFVPTYGPLDEEQQMLLGKDLARRYRNGFLIEEPDGSTRPITMFESLITSRYVKRQREIAAWRGCCGKHEYRTATTGERICMHTSAPCRLDSLSSVLAIITAANGGKTMGSMAVAERQSVSLIPAKLESAVRNLAQVSRAAQQSLAESRGAGELMEMAFVKAAAVQALREAFTDELLDVAMQLMNTKLGFSTDRDPKKGDKATYGREVVKDVLIEGAVQGANWHGNEINIIVGGLYLTREFYERVFIELPGVSDVQPPALGIPKKIVVGDIEYAEVQAELKYRVDGRAVCTDCSGRNAIRVRWQNKGTIDFIHGKVRKRLYKAAYEQVTGHTFDEVDESGIVDGEVIADTVVEESEDPIDPLAGVQNQLQAFDQKREVLAFGETKTAELEAMNLTEAELTLARNVLFELVEKRCTEIHNGRGPRSNRK